MRLLSRISEWVRRKILSKTFLKFNIVGASGIVVNMVAFWLLTNLLEIHHLIAGALATEVAILNNFTLNHLWTFRERRKRMPVLVRLAAFHGSRLLGLLITVGTLYLLADLMGVQTLLAYLFAVGFGVLANFYTSDVFVWAER